MKMNTLVVFTACSACAFAGVASAVNTVDVTFLGTGAGTNVNVWLGGHNHNGFAGQLMLGLSNSTGGLSNGNYTAFCSELDQYIGGTFNYNQVGVDTMPTPGAGMGTAAADAIARMWFCAGGLQYGNDNDFAAAFQVAVWEIAYDSANGWDTSSGNFYSNVGFNAAMNADLATLCAWAYGNGPMTALTGLSNGDRQDQIVPGPGTVALLGVAGLIAGRRRRS